MTLNKQNLDIKLSVLNESVDDKMLPDGAFTVVENARFDKEGRIEKRYGYTAFSKTGDTFGAAVDNGDYLIAAGSELVLLDGTDVWSYRPTSDRWNLRNRMTPCGVSIDTVFGNTTDKIILDSCSAPKVEAVLYTSKTYNGLYAALFDPDTRAIVDIVEVLTSSNTIEAARCIHEESTGVIAMVYSNNSSGNVVYKQLNTAGETITTQTLAGSMDTTKKQLELITLNNNILMAVWATAADIYAEVFYQNQPTTPLYSGNLGITTDTVFAVKKHYSSTDWYIGTHVGTTMRCYKFDDTLSLLATSPTTTITNPTRMTAAWRETGGTYNLLFFHDSRDEEDAGSGNSDSVDYNALNEAASTLGGANIVAENAWLAGSAISRTEDSDVFPYVLLGIKDEEQSFYGLFRIQPVDSKTNLSVTMVSKFLILEAAEDEEQVFVPRWIDEDNAVFACLKRSIAKEVDVSDLYQNLKMCRVAFDFSPRVHAVKFSNNYYLGAGPVKLYDGMNIRFAEFNTYPVLENTTITNGGGSIANGVYQYVAIYETLDAHGQVIRSAPSVPLSVTVDKAAGASSVSIRYKTPSFHDHDTLQADLDSYYNVRMKLYRTVSGGAIFYLVDIITDLSSTAPGQTYTTVVDTLADSAITDEETVYTTGGELENISISAVTELVAHKNRLFVAGADDRKKVYYSKTSILGEAVGFYSDLNMVYEADVTGLASLEDKLVVFGEDQLSFVAGDGPDNLGNNNTFQDFYGVSDEIGCIDSKSIVTTDAGVFFLSKRGMYLLGKSLGLSYVGSSIEDTLDSANIIRGVHLPGPSEARWLLDDETILVYNYKFSAWSVFKTFTNAVDIAANQDDFYILFSDGTVWKENTTLFTDSNTSYSMKFTTGWISLSQFNNLKRVYEIALLGSYQGGHILNVELAYDYDDTVVDTLTWDPTQLGDTESYQLRIGPSRQKIFAVKATLYDDSWLSGSKEAWSFSSLALTVGMKSTSRQLKADKSI